jgi:hypothetical protein
MMNIGDQEEMEHQEMEHQEMDEMDEMDENLTWEDLVRSTEKVAEQFAVLKQKMVCLEDDFERLSKVLCQVTCRSETTEPEMDRESTAIEEMEERYERRFTSRGHHLSKGKKQRMMLYSHRATRIEMMAIEKRVLKISKGKNSFMGKKNHGKDGSRVTLEFQKVKKVIDEGRKKMNKEWQRAHRPRNTRPWGGEEEK